MFNNKFFKTIVVLLCVVFLFSVVGCKSNTDTTVSDLSSVLDSADPDRDQTNSSTDDTVTSSGVELEEDVFDNTDTDNTVSSQPSTSSDNNTNSSNNSSTNTSSNTESNDSSNESGTESGNDGTIKLPVDWF